jgi:hypothetical protein
MADNYLVPYRGNPVLGPPRNSVAYLFGRVLGSKIDLRRGGLPEDLPKGHAERLLALLKNSFPKTIDPRTGQVRYESARAGILTPADGEPCLPNLCREAKTMLADAVRLLLGIRPLDPHGDTELVEARKAIMESEFKALTHELCLSQPRFFQIEKLLAEANRNIDELIKEIGVTGDKSVNTPDEDAVVVSLRVIRDYICCLKRSFCAFKQEHFGLACLLQEIRFNLQVVVETVPQARSQLAEDGVTESDLRVFRLRPPDTDYIRAGCLGSPTIRDTLTAEAFLSLNEYEADRLMQVVERSGKIGAFAIRTYVDGIVEQFHGVLGPPHNYFYLHHLTKDETYELITTAVQREKKRDYERFKSTASNIIFEFIRRYPRTLFFLFKLQSLWEEVSELIEKVDNLKPEIVGRDSDQQSLPK